MNKKYVIILEETGESDCFCGVFSTFDIALELAKKYADTHGYTTSDIIVYEINEDDFDVASGEQVAQISFKGPCGNNEYELFVKNKK